MTNKNENNEKSFPKVTINWYPGHMAKTKKEIIQDLKLIDVVIELLDARIPISSQNPNLREIIGNKKKIIALNKCDLADDEENKKWISYFENKNEKAVLTDSNSGKGVNVVLRQVQKLMEQDLQEEVNRGRVGKSIRIMVLGIPNVGKSSFINRISKRTSAGVENKPGFTKKKQWVRVANNIELLDTPGVLWPKFESEEVALNLSYVGTIKDEILQTTEIAFYLLKYLLENYENNIIERYKISKERISKIMENIQNPNEQIMEILYEIGKKRGALVSGGMVDEEKVSRVLLEDFRTGKLGKISLERIK